MKVLLSVAAVALALAATSGRAAPADQVSRRPDGSAIHWTIDRQSERPKQGILLIAQGSGCLAASENPNIQNAKRLLPDFAVLTVEKHGVEPHAQPKDPFDGCPAAFYAHHTVSQRVEDCAQVLRELRAEPWWDGQLVLFGGSEGGAVVALLTPRVEATATVVFSSAPGHSFVEIFKLSVPPAVAQGLDAELEKIKAEPSSSKVWGGNSYRWWSDILRLDMTAEMLRSRSPILLVQGRLDASAPVAVARAIRDEFQQAGRDNFIYWEFSDYDHGMKDAQGASHLEEVMVRIRGWLQEKVARVPDVRRN